MKTVMKVVKKKVVMKKAGAAMKSTMKAKKVSKIARGRSRYFMVYKGKREKTVGGVKATDLTKNKYGKIVTKKRSASGKKHQWMKATAAARKALGITGFVAMNSGPQGKELYAKARALYAGA